MALILIVNEDESKLVQLEKLILGISSKLNIQRALKKQDAIFYGITLGPDLIIVDCESKSLDIDDLLVRLSTNQELENIPVILLFNEKTEEIFEKYTGKNVEAILFKPLYNKELSSIIRLIFKKSELSKQKTDIAELLQIIQRQTTQHIKSEIQIETKMLFFYSLINTIPSPIFFKNTDSEFINCNREFCKYVGLHENDIIGKKAREILSKDLAIKFHEHDHEVMRKKIKVTVEAQIPHQDGKLHEIIIHKSPFFTTSKEPEGIVGVMIDITKEKQAAEKLQEAQEIVEEAENHKNMLITNITGEIKIPAENILNFVKKIKKGDKTEEEREILIDKILFSTNDLIAYIDNVLTLTNIESSSYNVKSDHFYLDELLDEVFIEAIENRKRKEKSYIELILQNAIDEHLLIRSDKNLISQTLLHIIDNALKFTKEGFVRIEYEIVKKESKKYIQFLVEDTGIGIDIGNLEIIFNKFAKLPESEFYPGAGLGLCLARNYVKLLYGKIWATSQKGRGSKFYFTIPYKQ